MTGNHLADPRMRWRAMAARLVWVGTLFVGAAGAAACGGADEGVAETVGAFDAPGSGLSAAQNDGETVAAGESSAGMEDADALVVRREVFNYPALDRRDPFEPLSAGAELGPRFEDLRLSGILYSRAAGSVGVLVDRLTGRRFRVRQGDRLGDMRVLAITQTDVVLRVSAFGVSRDEALTLDEDDEGEGSGR